MPESGESKPAGAPRRRGRRGGRGRGRGQRPPATALQPPENPVAEASADLRGADLPPPAAPRPPAERLPERPASRPLERLPERLPERTPRPSAPVSNHPQHNISAISMAIREVSQVIESLKHTLAQMEEVLELTELAERQKLADEREIDSLRRALRPLNDRMDDRPREREARPQNARGPRDRREVQSPRPERGPRDFREPRPEPEPPAPAELSSHDEEPQQGSESNRG